MPASLEPVSVRPSERAAPLPPPAWSEPVSLGLENMTEADFGEIELDGKVADRIETLPPLSESRSDRTRRARST